MARGDMMKATAEMSAMGKEDAAELPSQQNVDDTLIM
jgi:hypothetical protein